MAISQHKSGDGQGQWKLEVYSADSKKPVFTLIKHEAYDAVAGGDQSAAVDAIVFATADALAFGGS